MKKLSSIICLVLNVSMLNAQVVFYTDCNYHGTQSYLGAGTYQNNQRYNLPANSLSSIRIPNGYRVELWTEANLQGNRTVYTENVNCLGSNINDRTKSIRITHIGSNVNLNTVVGVYDACNQGGTYAFLGEGSYSNLYEIIGLYAISSLRVPEGFAITIYSRVNFQGSSMAIARNINCLDNNWNNKAASARVSRIPVNSGEIDNGIAFFPGCQFQGTLKYITKGSYASADAAGYTGSAAMKVPFGYVATFYKEPNYGGSFPYRVNSNKPCLTGWTSNDVKSLKIEYVGRACFDPPAEHNDAVYIYSGCEFSGFSKRLVAGEYRDLRANSSLDLTIYPSSIVVPYGWEAVLYHQPQFAGASVTVKVNDPCFSSSWRGKV